MKLREGKISLLSLIFITVLTVLLMILEFSSKSRVEAEYFQEKIEAATLTSHAFTAIRQAADELNLPIDRINDPNETGLIGLQYSSITTERGDLNAKLTTTNPNFAALIIQLLKDADVKKDDVVAISFTGSLPALNIAVLSALDVLELKPIIVTSVGASMWGANYPQFTYLDMENVLNQRGLIAFKTEAASIGGEDDIGRGLSPEGRENIMQAIERNNIEQLDIKNVEDAINKRFDIYNNVAQLFINVGGGATALHGTHVGSGLIKAGHVKFGKGMIAQFSQLGIPIINLVDINHLAEKHKLPIAPIPLPNIGEGSLYYEYRYSVGQAILYLLILLFILFIIVRYDIGYYLKRRKDD